MNRAAIAVAVVVSSVQFGWAFCPDGTVSDGGACRYVAPDQSAKWVSKETAPRQAQPEWERGEAAAQMLPVQTYDDKTGGTEKADQIKWAKAHETKAPAPIQVSSEVGKPAE